MGGLKTKQQNTNYPIVLTAWAVCTIIILLCNHIASSDNMANSSSVMFSMDTLGK